MKNKEKKKMCLDVKEKSNERKRIYFTLLSFKFIKK